MSRLTVDLIEGLVAKCHGASRAGGWWTDLATGEPLKRNKGEMLALIHTEIGEAYRGREADSKDNHILYRRSEEVELADTVIRICDYVGGWALSGFAGKVDYADSKPTPEEWRGILEEVAAEDVVAPLEAYHRFRLYVDDAIEHARKGRAVGEEESLAILLVEINDWCEANGYDLLAPIVDKLTYNANRADHKPENRMKDGGKAF